MGRWKLLSWPLGIKFNKWTRPIFMVKWEGILRPMEKWDNAW
jgi:hypothetical protein